MANDEKKLTIKMVEWDQLATESLSKALTRATPDELREQVENGGALFRVEFENQVVANFVLRIDQTQSRREGVIVAGQGCLNGVDLTKEIVPLIEEIFRQNGCDCVRYHTILPGIVRKMGALGYRPAEFVATKDLV